MQNRELKNIVECEYCGTFIDISSINSSEKSKCPRCHMGVNLPSSYSIDSLYYAISAFFIFILLNIYPLISYYLGPKELTTTLLESVIVLYKEGFYFVCFLVLFTIVISPLATILLIIYSFIHNHTQKEIIPRYYLFNLFQFFKYWGFVDVFIVSVIVAYIKLIDMSAATKFDTGFYLVLLYVFLFFMANKNFEIHSVFKGK